MSSDVQSVVQKVMDAMPSPVFVMDQHGQMHQQNSFSKQLLTQSLVDWASIAHFDDLELSSSFLKKRIFWSDIAEVVDQEELEMQVTMFNSGKFYKLRISKVEQDQSKFFLIAFAEITSKIQLQDELLAPNGFLDQFLNGLPQLICAIDEHQLIRFWNKQCEQVLGFSDHDVCSSDQGFERLIPNPRTRQEVLEKLLKRESENIHHINAEMTSKDGISKIISWSVRYQKHPQIDGVSYWLIGHDVTAFQRAMNVLIESEHRYSIISKASNDAVWDWDLLSDELWWNEGMTSIFGYHVEEIHNTYEWWLERVHPNYVDSVNEKLQRFVKEGKEFWTDEYLFRKKDGSYALVFDKGYIVKNEKGKPIRFIGGMVDITSIRENSE